MKGDFSNYKWLFQIEDDDKIDGKCTCDEFIAINTELSNFKTTMLFRLALGKEKLEIFVFPAQSYI